MFEYAREVLEKHSADMRQFIDCRESVLDNGMRVVDVHNSSGLTFTLLPDRGLDVWSAHYRGAPLTWLSPGSPHPPDHGSAWLRQFNGGLLTTCGLQHAGPPEVDEATGEERDVHGHYTRLRAEILRREGRWESEAYLLELKGRVVQSRLFGEQLQLERTYRICLGKPTIEIVDAVTNRADVPLPFMLLYHFNLGYPLVRDGARFEVAAADSWPRDDAAAAGFDAWPVYTSAQAEFAEQVFYHHVLEEDGFAKVVHSNGDIGLMLTWDTTYAPYLTQWKNVRKGIYVSGVEPGNCVPEGRNAADRAGRLAGLEPGETQSFYNRLDVIPDQRGLAEAERALEHLRSSGVPVSGFEWRP